MTQDVRTFGVKEVSRASGEMDWHIEAIRLAGYTILDGVLSAAELESARQRIEAVYDRQVEEIGGRDKLEAIGDTYTAMCLLAYDDFFLNVATQTRVLRIVEVFLGDFYTLMLQNGIINVPQVGHDQTAGYWHRDLGYQHVTTSRPLGITALYCIDDFCFETGGTYVLPGSHRTEAFPSDEYVRAHEQAIEARAGSVILFDSMLYHRGGHNRSSRVRRGINNIYTLPLIKQQINLPSILKGKYRDDAFLSKLLGYASETDNNVVEFRRRRLKRVSVR